MHGISLRNVSVKYRYKKVLHDITVRFPKGLSLVLGLNGAGKTTLLRVIAGLVNYEGNVFIDGSNVDGLPPSLRGVSYVPQRSALIPTLKVWQNIALGLIDRGYTRKQVMEKVETVASILGVQHLLDRYPASLSGGEARRVAIARALAVDEEVVLMDEPEVSVDALTWKIVCRVLAELIRRGKTVILVTHNFEEMMQIARTLCILRDGRAVFAGPPSSLESSELPLDVKSWLGVTLEADGFLCETEEHCYAVLNNNYKVYVGARKTSNKKILVPPKYVNIRGERGSVKGKVVEVVKHSSGNYLLRILINEQELVAATPEAVPIGADVYVSLEKAIPLSDRID